MKPEIGEETQLSHIPKWGDYQVSDSDSSDNEPNFEEEYIRLLKDLKWLRDEAVVFDDQQDNLLKQIMAEEKELRESAFLKVLTIEKLMRSIEQEDNELAEFYETHRQEQVSTSALKRSKAIQEADDPSNRTTPANSISRSKTKGITQDQFEELKMQKERQKQSLLDKHRKLRELQEEIFDENVRMQQETDLRERMADHLEHYEETLVQMGTDMAHLMDGLRELNNEYQNLIGTIRVNVRVRPLQESETRDFPVPTVRCISRTEMVMTVPADLLKSEHHVRSYDYDFEQIYDQDASQDDLFRELSTLIQSSVDGYAVCVFAYGQTGAGKTYTMIGGEGPEMGLLPRTVDLIFERFKALEGAGIKCSIDISFVEIYNEKMKDLIEHTGKEIKDLTLTSVKSKEQLVEKIYLARQKRSTAKTGSNEVSSRSHAIFHIRITCLHTEKKKPKTTVGSVTIVDLAGSERLKESKTIGDRFQETRAINSSLSSLKDVISSLSKKESYIPYRNSLLTQVLEPYLGKESKTLVIINVSPFALHYSQTNGSLLFGKQLRNCTNKVAEKRPQALSIMSSGKKNPMDRLNSSFSSVSNQIGPLTRMGSGVKVANRGHEAAIKKSLSSSILSETMQPESRHAGNSRADKAPASTGGQKFPSFLKPTASSSSKGSSSFGISKPSTPMIDENSNTSNLQSQSEHSSFRPIFTKRLSPIANESLLLSPIEESPAHKTPYRSDTQHRIVPETSLLSGIEEVDHSYTSTSHRKPTEVTPRFGLDIEYASHRKPTEVTPRLGLDIEFVSPIRQTPLALQNHSQNHNRSQQRPPQEE